MRMKKTDTVTKKKKSTKAFLQLLPRWSLKPAARCRPSASTSGSTAKRLRKTPRSNAKTCRGLTRVGQNGTHLYVARPHRQRNPRYASSTTRSAGSHLTFRWDKVYDTRTKKPVKVSALPRGFPLLYA